MERYLGGEEIGADVLVATSSARWPRGSFHPVLPVCATTGVGCAELLDLVVRGFPAPPPHPAPRCSPPPAPADPLTLRPDGPLVAEVVKTTSDPYVGRVSLVRVFSGTLDAGQPGARVRALHVVPRRRGGPRRPRRRRAGRLARLPFGQQQAPAKRVVAGDIALVGRLSRAETGDTLSGDAPRVLRPWTMPDAAAAGRDRGRDESDEDKLSTALARLPRRTRRCGSSTTPRPGSW